MSLPIAPNPFPTLRQGLSLGAPEHQGFAAAWNWLTGVMRKAKEYFVLAVNGKHGELTIVGGDGIQVVTSGSTITINVGDGEDENDGGSGGGGSGGSGGYGGTVVFPSPAPTPSPSGGSGGTVGFPIPAPTPSPGPVSSGGGGSDCNKWSGGGDNGGRAVKPENVGDDCKELNGW